MTIPTPAEYAERNGGRRRATTSRTRVFLVVAVPLVVVGLVAGAIWPFLVPDVRMVMTTEGPYPISELQAGGVIAMDGWYAALAAIGGLLTGAVLATVFMRHGLVMVAALLVGSVLAAAGMYAVGSLIGNGELILRWQPGVEPGTGLLAPLQVHAYGVFVVWPLAALSSVLPLALFSWPFDEVEAESWDGAGEPASTSYVRGGRRIAYGNEGAADTASHG